MAQGLTQRLAKKPFQFVGKNLVAFFLKKAQKYIFEAGAIGNSGSLPSTPKGIFFINQDGTTATRRIAVNVNGTYLWLTIN